jgi:hypothetical protein
MQPSGINVHNYLINHNHLTGAVNKTLLKAITEAACSPK